MLMFAALVGVLWTIVMLRSGAMIQNKEPLIEAFVGSGAPVPAAPVSPFAKPQNEH